MDAARQIENLLYRYAELIDAGDFEGLAALFSEAEIYAPAHDTVFRGADQVAAMYRASTRLYADTGTPKTRHIISNAIIEFAEQAGQATARSCYTVMQATDALPLQAIISGRYHDRFQASAQGWQFARREMHVDLIGDLSQHLLFDLQEQGNGT